MIVELLLTILIVYTTVRYLQYVRKFRDFSRIPGPKGYPLIGNALEIDNSPIGIFEGLKRLTKAHGPFFKLWIGPFGPTLVISSKQHVEYILGSNTHIDKSDNYNLLKPWLGEGLIVSNGDAWRTHRKMLTPSFHFKILEQFVPIFCSCSDKLVEKLKPQCEKTFDVYPYVNLAALDSICESAMGIKIGAQDTPNMQYVKSVKGFLDCHMERFFSVIKKNAFLAKFTKVYGVQVKHIEVLKSFAKDAIERRKQERKDQPGAAGGSLIDNFGQKKKIAFLDMMLDMEEKNGISKTEIREEVDNFMFAGHDTVSTSLSLALYQLSKHPDVQQAMLEEIKSEIPGDEVNHQKLQGLKYMDAVIKEVLRMHTTVPFIERQLREDVVIDGFTLPAGTNIIINIEDLHHSEDSFPEALKFKPERFFADESAKRHPYAYVPFSAGPRNCIGQKFAMLSMKTSLVKIISNFEIFDVPGFEPKLGNSAVLKSFNGVCIRLKRR